MEVFVLHPRGHGGDGTVENGCTISLDWELQLGSQVTNRWNPYRLDRPFPKPTQPVSRADLTKKGNGTHVPYGGVSYPYVAGLRLWVSWAELAHGLPAPCSPALWHPVDFLFLEKHVSDKTSWHPCFKLCSAVVVSNFPLEPNASHAAERWIWCIHAIKFKFWIGPIGSLDQERNLLNLEFF